MHSNYTEQISQETKKYSYLVQKLKGFYDNRIVSASGEWDFLVHSWVVGVCECVCE